MVPQVSWLDEAKDDLREIALYIASQSSDARGERVAREIYHTADVLLENPRAGPMIEEDARVHRHLICYSYRIIYRVEAKVLVVAVIHGARLLPAAVLRRK